MIEDGVMVPSSNICQGREDRKKEMSRQGGEHAPEELMSHLERESHLSLRRCCHKRTMASFSDF